VGLKILKGTYCLIINNEKNSYLRIGALGNILFKKGYYIYVGSAMNSLIPRLKRHLSSDKKKHWHIDYFLDSENVTIKEIIFTTNENKFECEIVKRINGKEIKNFGSSDCKCKSHLLYFEEFEECFNSVKIAFKDLNLNINNLQDFKKIKD
jgi:Uri superfamily endonuclease